MSSRHVPDLPSFDDTVKPSRATAAPPKLDLPPPFRELSRHNSKSGAAAADDDFDAYDAIAVAALDVPSTGDHSDDDDDNNRTTGSIKLTGVNNDDDDDDDELEEIDLGAALDDVGGDDDDAAFDLSDDNDDDNNNDDEKNSGIGLVVDDDDDDEKRSAPTRSKSVGGNVNALKSKLEGVVKPGVFAGGLPSRARPPADDDNAPFDLSDDDENVVAKPSRAGANDSVNNINGGDDDDDDDVSPPPPDEDDDAAGGDDDDDAGDAPAGAKDLLASIMGGGGGSKAKAVQKPISVERAVQSPQALNKWAAQQALIAQQEAAAKKARDAEIAAKRKKIAQMKAAAAASAAAEQADEDDADDEPDDAASPPKSAMDLIGDIMGNGGKKPNDKRRASSGDDVVEAASKPSVYIPGGGKARDAKLEDEARRQVLPPVERKQSQAARPLAVSDSAALADPQKPRKLYSAFLAPDAASGGGGGGAGAGGDDDDDKGKLVASKSSPSIGRLSNAPLPDDLRDPEEILIRYESSDEKYAPCFKLEFAVIHRPPLLKIPEGAAFTAYDYTENRKTPFQFRSVPDIVLEPPEISVQNPDADEPVKGSLSPHTPLKAIEKARKKVQFEAYEPRRAFPVLPPLESDVRKLDDSVRHTGLAPARLDPTTIRSLELVHVQLDKGALKPLGALLTSFTGLSHLTMRRCGVSKVLWSHPKLRFIDYSENAIAKDEAVVDALAKSPLCEVLLMAGNPVCGNKSFASRAVAVLPRLAQLDTVQIDVALRLKSLRNAGNSFQKKRIELVHWDLRVCESAGVRAMREWQPAALTSLALVDMGLTEFHVGSLVGLRDLNLSKNAIASTTGCGLEVLPKLRRVNLAANRLSSSKMLEPFPLCASLMSVALRDNRDGSRELVNYRALLIYMTRYLPGSNRASGLQEIDGKPIAIKERVAAMSTFGKKKDLPVFAFETHMVNYVGRAQLRDANYVANIRELQLPNAAVSEVSLRGMQHLEFLDLSGNHIVTVGALEECVRLRFVNLSGNAELDAKATVGVMAKAQQRLEQLSLCVLAAGHKRHPDSAKYRQYVLTALLQRNRKLDWLDTRPVTVDERAAAYAAALGAKATPHEIEKYRFYCALVQNCTMPMMRRLHPSDVLGGSQFDATQITILRQMASHSLRHVDFAAFVNLEELNLANNQLTDITKLGIDGLRKLRVLALHHNQLGNSLEQVAQFLDGFARLECVALRHNPCMKSPAERTRLIGLMRSLHKARCSLRVLDTEISIKERVAAWAQLGGSAEATERLRFEAVMYQRLPPDVPPERIESLDLTDSGMRTIDVTPYSALTCLLLSGNALTTLVGIGLETPQRLKVLDLRHNQLTNLVEVAKVVSNLPRLATLGVAGNPWATRDKSGYRHALLQLLPQLSERECALKVIDEERLDVDEIIAASKASKLVTTDKHLVRFQVLMLTRVPSGYRPSDITELNLSKAKLDTVDLAACPLLVKLSLARNELKSLKSANLHRLVRLRALDVSHNQLKDVTEFAAILALLPRLAVLLWVQNPIAGSPNSATPSAVAPKVSGVKALLPLDTLSSSQLAARESLFVKLAARRMGFNNADDVHTVPVVKSRGGVTIDVASLPLQVIDGRRVGVDELCEAMKSDKRFKKDDVEDARLNIAVRRAGASRGTVRSLDLSFCGFSSSLEALRGLRSLQTLNLSNNQLTKLEPGWLAPLVELEELDLRHNKFASLKLLLQVLVQSCPSLRVLYVEDATKNGKETAPGTEYPMKVCAVLRQLESCDGVANPYGVPLKTIKLAQQKRATLARERGATDAPVVAAKSAKKATIRIQRAPTAPSPVAPSAINPELAGVRDLADDDNNDQPDDDRPVAAYAGYDLGYMTMGLDMINH